MMDLGLMTQEETEWDVTEIKENTLDEVVLSGKSYDGYVYAALGYAAWASSV